MTMEKLCVFCDKLDFDYVAGGGETCGYGGEGHAEMKCKKRHWETDIAGGLLDYREKILKAQTCSDYVQVEVTPNVELTRGVTVVTRLLKGTAVDIAIRAIREA